MSNQIGVFSVCLVVSVFILEPNTSKDKAKQSKMQSKSLCKIWSTAVFVESVDHIMWKFGNYKKKKNAHTWNVSPSLHVTQAVCAERILNVIWNDRLHIANNRLGQRRVWPLFKCAYSLGQLRIYWLLYSIWFYFTAPQNDQNARARTWMRCNLWAIHLLKKMKKKKKKIEQQKKPHQNKEINYYISGIIEYMYKIKWLNLHTLMLSNMNIIYKSDVFEWPNSVMLLLMFQIGQGEYHVYGVFQNLFVYTNHSNMRTTTRRHSANVYEYTKRSNHISSYLVRHHGIHTQKSIRIIQIFHTDTHSSEPQIFPGS